MLSSRILAKITEAFFVSGAAQDSNLLLENILTAGLFIIILYGTIQILQTVFYRSAQNGTS